MNDYSITIKSYEKKGVLGDITQIITKYGGNISYTHLYVEKNNVGSINLELEHVELADQSDFYIQIRHYLFPPSLQAFRSLRADPAISWPQTMVAE